MKRYFAVLHLFIDLFGFAVDRVLSPGLDCSFNSRYARARPKARCGSGHSSQVVLTKSSPSFGLSGAHAMRCVMPYTIHIFSRCAAKETKQIFDRNFPRFVEPLFTRYLTATKWESCLSERSPDSDVIETAFWYVICLFVINLSCQ